MDQDNVRSQLVQLYAEMAELTLPECRSVCRVPLSCCSAEYCLATIDHARERWGVKLETTGHARLPLMGQGGCVAPPHLRPACTFHTCSVNGIGCKVGDAAWTEKYFELRYKIEELEMNLPG